MHIPVITTEINNMTFGLAVMCPPQLSMILNPIIITFFYFLTILAYAKGDIAIVRTFILNYFLVKSN